MTETEPRTPGRPRGRLQDSVAWDRAEDLFVHGEVVATGKGPTTKYPSLREIARRCNLTPQALHYRVKRFAWEDRRERFKATADAKVDEVVAEVRATETKTVLQVLEQYVALFAAAVEAKRVRVDSLTDLDRAVRLLAFVRGEADHRNETRHVISLEEIQRRHRESRGRAGEYDAIAAGVIGDSEEQEADYRTQ